MNVRSDWTATTWQNKQLTQQPCYENKEALDKVVAQMSKLPPLVTSWEVEDLKNQLAEAAEGKRFLLQGGDCAESFDECESSIIVNKLKILLQMSLILTHGSNKKVIRVGRFAGQYAKPRSSDTEVRDRVTLPSYRGDMINGIDFTKNDRIPKPELLLRGYERAALTLNFIRSLINGGFADLHHTDYWDLDFISHSPNADAYHKIVESIGKSIHFMETMTGAPIGNLNRVDFFTSHEGLNLYYEQAQTREVPHRPGWYNLSTHFPWIGNRTRQIDSAHVAYFRGIANPIGLKVGPSITPGELLDLIEILNPTNEPGRLTLIHRFGANKIAECLPPLIETVEKNEKIVLWCCDPMHGNNETTHDGVKTRNFDNILAELKLAFQIHQQTGSYLGGVHFELTGENVTECIGGARGLTEADLNKAYKSRVDPRLNYEQSLEMAMLIAQQMSRLEGKVK